MSDLKECIRCEVEQNIDEFKFFYSKKDNKTYRRNVCNTCTNTNKRAARLRRLEYYRKKGRETAAKVREELQDNYVETTLLNGYHIPWGTADPKLIEAQRANLQLHKIT